MEMTLDLIDHKTVQDVLLKPSLVVRASCALPPG